MVTRQHKTKRAAKEALEKITPTSFGTPKRKIRKRIFKTKTGYSSSVNLK